MAEEAKPLLVIKPKFTPLRFFLGKYALTIVAIIILMVMAMNVENTKIENIGMYFGIFIAGYLVYVAIRCMLKGRQFKRIQYLFYADRVVIMNDNRRGDDVTTIMYKQIVDVLMVQSYVHKFFNEGELMIKLGEGKVFAKAVTLIGIGNFEENVKKVTEIIYGN